MPDSDADHDDGAAVDEEPTPLQRVLDLLVFAPVGVALTVVEDLPGLIGKGRQRFETDVQNARVLGKFVVTHGQREVVERVGKLLHREDADTDAGRAATDDAADESTGPGTVTPLAGGAATASPSSSTPSSSTPSSWAPPPSAPPAPDPKPHADPADVLIVEGALAGYDTLSASQVVRRLESLGPDELEAIHRHEASHRNRRTILNRAHQILEAKAGGAGGGTGGADAPETDRPAE